MVETSSKLYIFRALGIILMVFGHSGIYGRMLGSFLSPFNFVYLFHMSLFFFYSGYFFREKNIDTPLVFLRRKVMGLYYPMIKYGLLFLLLRNIMIPLHLSSQTPFVSWQNFLESGLFPTLRFYDTEQMIGAFWFLRVLFFVNLIFWALLWVSRLLGGERYKIYVLSFGIVSLSALGYYYNAHDMWPFLNWVRELCVLPIFFVGYLMGSNKLKIPIKWWIALPALAWLIYLSPNHFIGIGQYVFGTPWFFLSTSFCGIYFTMWVAERISVMPRVVSLAFTYIGERTFDILIWHFFSFKLVSYLRIVISDLPIERLAEFPILDPTGRFDFIAYTIVGVGLPLLMVPIANRIGSYLKRAAAR